MPPRIFGLEPHLTLLLTSCIKACAKWSCSIVPQINCFSANFSFIIISVFSKQLLQILQIKILLGLYTYHTCSYHFPLDITRPMNEILYRSRKV